MIQRHPDRRVQDALSPPQARIRHAAPEPRRVHAAPLLARRGARLVSRRAQPDRPTLLRDRRAAAGLRAAVRRLDRTELECTDALLGEVLELVDDSTVVLVGTGLGQRPYDPVGEIHNPVVRLVREHELFTALGFRGATVLTQINPDVTVSLADDATAGRAETGSAACTSIRRRGCSTSSAAGGRCSSSSSCRGAASGDAAADTPQLDRGFLGALRTARARARDHRPVDRAPRGRRMAARLLRLLCASSWCVRMSGHRDRADRPVVVRHCAATLMTSPGTPAINVH